MEESWENWHLHTEMDCDDDIFIDKCYTDDDEFLREILLQPSDFSSESESDHHLVHASSTVQNNTSTAAEGGVLSSEGMEEKKRKRRQELTERFIALSATIPGLSKTDKASVLRAAIDYVKKLQERVQELEKHDKKRASVETVIVIKKPDVSGNELLDPTSSETSCDDCSILPEIEARMLGNEVLIEIHCEKQNGIELKIMDHLENLHLSVTGSSVLPFGNSALSLTIIAQVGEGYKMTVNDLVRSLRQLLLKMASKCDPY
ncbi:Myc-type, basic helix-loop-helix [Sesbania bispinosa]|nr:Myc-type, basic helix-loop-helix [Sesbania bispinosa]